MKLLAVAALCLGIALAPSPAQASATTSGGYTLITPTMKGTPYHQHITLSIGAYGRGSLAYYLARDAQQLRNVGISVAYTGAYPVSSNGRIYVTSYQADFCYSNLLAKTFITWGWYYPVRDFYMIRSTIVVCPSAFTRGGAFLNLVLRHELGHSQGLAHYDYTYNGEYQIMRYVAGSAYDYRQGDLNGLSYLAYHSYLLRHGGT